VARRMQSKLGEGLSKGFAANTTEADHTGNLYEICGNPVGGGVLKLKGVEGVEVDKQEGNLEVHDTKFVHEKGQGL
jgi:hypothetical protein